MIIFAILGSLAAIALLCWLLFTLAVFALPVFIGATAGAWAHGSGAGLLGALLVGLAAATVALTLGQLLLAFVRLLWIKLLVAGVFVAPAGIAGFYATHGLVKHLMPDEGWQLAFSIIGALAVGVTTLVRIAGMTAGPQPQGSIRLRA